MPAGQGIGARATWRLRDLGYGIGAAIVALLVLQGVLVGPALAAFGEHDTRTQAMALVATIAWDGALAGIVYWLVKRRGGTWSSLGWRRPCEGEDWSVWRIVRTVLGGYACMWAVLAVYNVIVNLLGLDALLPDQQLPSELFDEVWVIPIMGAAIVFGAPIGEELFFRAFLYGGLRARWAVPVPALTTGILFAIAHGQFGLIVPFMLIGAILAVMYERTGSIWMSMALHFCFNLVSFLILLSLPDARGS
jgi:membrane protease YdiL (CAAX protease family)